LRNIEGIEDPFDGGHSSEQGVHEDCAVLSVFVRLDTPWNFRASTHNHKSKIKVVHSQKISQTFTIVEWIPS